MGRRFESPFPGVVMRVIEMYYHRKSVGIVICWKPDNGYGFIKEKNCGQDVFVHFKDISKYPRKPRKNRSLQKGEAVEFVHIHVSENGKTRGIFVTGPNGQSVKGYLTYHLEDKPLWNVYLD